MISLRAKFTLALLAMSFVAVGVVGITARWITQVRFDDLVVNRAMQGFISEITEYYETYGSWETAQTAESFNEFVSRTRPEPVRPVRRQRPLPAGGEPAPPEKRLSFLVADRSGRVLIDLAGYREGYVITPNAMERAQPILLGNTEIGLAVPVEKPVLTEVEERYLSAIEFSWLYSLLVAILLAIPIGIVLGNLFSAPIQDLRKAIRAMQGGALRQLVRVRSNDEIGQLSAAFNQMSENLAIAHDELESSRARLSEQAEELKELSRRDELTHLLNRRAFDDLTSNLFAQARRFEHPLTLAMADVDHFKKVNDEYSHATGDAVLREVAGLISRNIREIDLLARYGGEEFAIAFPQTDIAGATRFANRIRELVAAFNWAGIAPDLFVTISIGLAERTTEASFKETLNKADAKLYEAKSNGRNQVCY